MTLAEQIDALLPQTQCTRCGFPTCRAYADAIASGEADIDRCPPGGADGVAALADLLGIVTKPLDPAYGTEAPPIVALIDELASARISASSSLQYPSPSTRSAGYSPARSGWS